MTDGSTFSLLFDDVVADVGLVTAAVYGVLWRYCQRRDEKCYASQQHLADHIGITRQTLNKHISTLVEKGYILDATPERKGDTHTYRLTNKRDGTVTVGDTDDAPAQEAPVNETDNGCQADLQPPVNEIDTRNTSQEHNEDVSRDAVQTTRAFSGDERQHKPNDSWAWINVLCEVCRLDIDLSKGKAGKFAKRFRSAGYTIDEVRDYYGAGGWWYRVDFRGKRGDPPTLEAIHETLRKAREFRPGDGSPAAEFTTPKMVAWG